MFKEDNLTKNQKKENCRELIKRLDDVRLNATSVHELINNSCNILAEYDIILEFCDYPTEYHEFLSNYHSSPKGYKCNFNKDEDIPKGYPGFSGKWVGKLKRSTKYIDEYFSGINFLENLMPWLKFGTGSSGDDFNIGGTIWLYDLPKLHNEYKISHNIDFKVLREEKNRKQKEFLETIIKKRDNFINTNDEIILLRKNLLNLEKLRLRTTEAIEIKKRNLTNQYNRVNLHDIQLENLTYLDDYNSKKMKELLAKGVDIKCPQIHKLIEQVQEVNKEFDNFIENNPELFI